MNNAFTVSGKSKLPRVVYLTMLLSLSFTTQSTAEVSNEDIAPKAALVQSWSHLVWVEESSSKLWYRTIDDRNSVHPRNRQLSGDCFAVSSTCTYLSCEDRSQSGQAANIFVSAQVKGVSFEMKATLYAGNRRAGT
jgi:hypothetical protein